jgi:predicted MFS family arabinose efflux permease
MKKVWQKLETMLFHSSALWSANLMVLASALFLNRFGQELLGSVRTNFFIDTLGLTGGQVLWLEGIREIPGLALIFIAALMMRLPLSRRAALSVLITGIGYGLYAFIHSYTALLAVAVVASLGLHMWMPLNNSLGMCLSPKNQTGQVLGMLSSIGALGGLIGMGALSLFSRATVSLDIPLGIYYLIGGAFIIMAALLIFKLPTDIGTTTTEPPRILLKRRYWLYYVLTFFEGSRKQVLHTFGMLVLVENFGLEVWQISSLLLASSIVNLIGIPQLGKLIDHFGERKMLTVSYIILALCCVGFATVHTVLVLILLLITIKLMVTLSMGLSTYVYHIAPPEELTPTLSAGISINHVTSVAMPLIAGALLPHIGYEGIFLGTAAIIGLSVPFALALQARSALAPPQTSPVGAE